MSAMDADYFIVANDLKDSIPPVEHLIDHTFPDGKPDGRDGLASCLPYVRNVKGIEAFLRELKNQVFDPLDCVTVSEAVDVPYSSLGDYIGKQGCFSMMFDFSYTNYLGRGFCVCTLCNLQMQPGRVQSVFFDGSLENTG